MHVQDIYSTLAQLDITHERVDHPPVYTSEQARKLVPISKGASVKNLFLRNRKGKRHYLIVMPDDKGLDLIILAEKIKATRLSFASHERLLRYLGVEPGAVSPLAVIHDSDQQVELWIDQALQDEEFIHCHPLVNTATLILAMDDLKRFFAHTGHEIHWLDL